MTVRKRGLGSHLRTRPRRGGLDEFLELEEGSGRRGDPLVAAVELAVPLLRRRRRRFWCPEAVVAPVPLCLASRSATTATTTSNAAAGAGAPAVAAAHEPLQQRRLVRQHRRGERRVLDAKLVVLALQPRDRLEQPVHLAPVLHAGVVQLADQPVVRQLRRFQLVHGQRRLRLRLRLWKALRGVDVVRVVGGMLRAVPLVSARVRQLVVVVLLRPSTVPAGLRAAETP